MDVEEPKIHPSTTAGLDSHFNFSLLAFTGTKVNFYFPETYTNFSQRQKPKSVSSNGTSFSHTIPTVPYKLKGSFMLTSSLYLGVWIKTYLIIY